MSDRTNGIRGWVHAVDDGPETRAKDGGGKALRVGGYAVLWDTPSEMMGRLVETMDRAAFEHLGDLNERDVRFLDGHGGAALARTKNGTLRITQDDTGVAFEADLNPGMSTARDLHAAIERGDVTQMSFGFDIETERVWETDDGVVRAHVTRVGELYEVSAVTFPAYEPTSVEARMRRMERAAGPVSVDVIGHELRMLRLRAF